MNEPVELASDRPLWLNVVRWMLWLAMLACIVAFASRHGGGAFIYQNF
jgi:hypothetical protein